MNGSATYACSFKDVFVPDEWILADDAQPFCDKIRLPFVAYQIPIGFGVIEVSVESMEKVKNRQNGCNRYLSTQPADLTEALKRIKKKFYDVLQKGLNNWKELVSIRLETVYLTLKVVQANMLHHGSPAYLANSDSSRRLREVYFYANLTPTVKHLEKLLHEEQ